MSPADTERLEALAAAVLDGRPIDWAGEESSAGSDALRSAIGHLRVLHDVVGGIGREPARPPDAV